MAKERIKGGGFLRGIFYGLFVSGVIFFGLSVTFPLVEAAPTVAPTAAMIDPVQIAPQTFGAGPDNIDGSGVSIGSANDSLPDIGSGNQLDSGAPVVQPDVETQSAAVPDVDDGNNQQTEVEAQTESVAEPVAVAALAEPVAPVETSSPPALIAAASGDAFDVFSVPFTREPSLPMLAIIFEDTLEVSLQQLFNADIPLNFAVVGRSNDTQTSQNFRNSGFEVLAMMSSDMEIDDTLSEKIGELIDNVPASIGVIDNSLGGVMRDSGATQSMIENAAVRGMAVVAFAGAGDVTARNVSQFFGRPFGTVSGMIDSTNDIALIKSALDQAALDAVANGSVIVFARTRPRTVQALLEWLTSTESTQVQIVPVSQILRPNPG